MKLRILFAILILAAAVPVFAAPNCGTYQVVGSQCATNIVFAWGTAGLGTDSLITIYVPPAVSAPVTYQLTQLNSSIGTSYAGFFGVDIALLGNAPKVVTPATASALTPGPGQGGILHITGVCFDPTCTQAGPAAAVANMFSAQFQVLASSASDLQLLPPALLTVRFLDSNGNVTWEEQETAVSSTPTGTEFVVDVAEGATPATRYVYSGSAVTYPFMALSVTNPSATIALAGTAYLYDTSGNIFAKTAIPAIPPSGAAGYLLIGRTPGDTLGLFPSSTVLPLTAGNTTGIYISALAVVFDAPAIFLGQDYDGDAMLNLVVYPVSP